MLSVDVDNRSGAECTAGPYTVRSGDKKVIRITEDLTLRIGDNAHGFVRVSEWSAAVTDDGGAFAVAKILKSESNVLGGLSLKELSIGMALFSAVMVVDVFAFGLRSKREPIPNVFNGVGQAVVILLGALICVGWLLVGFG